MVHHGFDKIQNVDGFSANVVAKFFGFLPGPPQFWTLSAAATQIAGAGLLSIGLLSRPTAAAMSATMITAVIFHLLNTGGEAFPLGIPKAHSYNYELAAMCTIPRPEHARARTAHLRRRPAPRPRAMSSVRADRARARSCVPPHASRRPGARLLYGQRRRQILGRRAGAWR